MTLMKVVYSRWRDDKLGWDMSKGFLLNIVVLIVVTTTTVWRKNGRESS